MKPQNPTTPADPRTDDYLRIPGLFRRWELEQVIEVGNDFYLEDAGSAADGTPLVAIYYRLHPASTP